MRLFYLISILVLTFLSIGLSLAHLYWRPAPPDPAVRWTVPANELAPPPPRARHDTSIQTIREQNLFSPSRGSVIADNRPSAAKRNPPPRFELVGICRIGNCSGAIIEVKNAPSGLKTDAKKRHYYTLNDDVGGGFILTSVGENSVIVKRQHETLELKITRKRFAGQKKATPPSQAQNTPPPTVLPVLRRRSVGPAPGVNPDNQSNGGLNTRTQQ